MADAISKEQKLGQKLLKGASRCKKLSIQLECVGNVLFFEENGLPHHFRVAHKKNITLQDINLKIRH